MTGNGLQLPEVQFENASYRSLLKDTIFVDICKAKITVFTEGNAFTNAYTKIRIFGSCC
jgi:uncharacterized membrane protein YdfJ with MMPL/SSD domain